MCVKREVECRRQDLNLHEGADIITILCYFKPGPLAVGLARYRRIKAQIRNSR